MMMVAAGVGGVALLCAGAAGGMLARRSILAEGIARELEVRLAELKESAQREITTARHRATTDVSNAKLYSAQSFATDVLEVADNLDRAKTSFEATKGGGDAETLLQGVEMTRQGLLRVFGRHGVTQIPAEYGGEFDPNEHEAIASIPLEEAATIEGVTGAAAGAGSVAVVAQEGYRLNDRVLRPARVVVVEGQASAAAGAGGGGGDDGAETAGGDAVVDAPKGAQSVVDYLYGPKV